VAEGLKPRTGLPDRTPSVDPSIAARGSPIRLVIFARAGLDDLVHGRIHSAYDMIALGKRGKPAPDLFLAAAAAEPVPRPPAW
jgi:beta-phosphoglucomutase-like phosphatase (HAD superfamily)